LPGTQIAIRDPDRPGVELERGRLGEICVQGPQVMAGYWNQPEATRAAFVDGLLRTGDLGYLGASGDLVIVDRAADVIHRAGVRVLPRLIEDALHAEPAVAEAIAVGIPDPDAGEVPIACVTIRPGHEATASSLMAAIATRLWEPELPVVIDIRQTLPKTVIGKLSRLAVREEFRRRTGRLASLTQS
jgi:long-chain acyl-CoA synthetase